MASSAFRAQCAGSGLRSSSAKFWNAPTYGRNTASARRPVFGESYLPSEFGAKVSVWISASPSSLLYLLLRGQFRDTVRNPNQQTVAETYLSRQVDWRRSSSESEYLGARRTSPTETRRQLRVDGICEACLTSFTVARLDLRRLKVRRKRRRQKDENDNAVRTLSATKFTM